MVTFSDDFIVEIDKLGLIIYEATPDIYKVGFTNCSNHNTKLLTTFVRFFSHKIDPFKLEDYGIYFDRYKDKLKYSEDVYYLGCIKSLLTGNPQIDFDEVASVPEVNRLRFMISLFLETILEGYGESKGNVSLMTNEAQLLIMCFLYGGYMVNGMYEDYEKVANIIIEKGFLN